MRSFCLIQCADFQGCRSQLPKIGFWSPSTTSSSLHDYSIGITYYRARAGLRTGRNNSEIRYKICIFLAGVRTHPTHFVCLRVTQKVGLSHHRMVFKSINRLKQVCTLFIGGLVANDTDTKCSGASACNSTPAASRCLINCMQCYHFLLYFP